MTLKGIINGLFSCQTNEEPSLGKIAPDDALRFLERELKKIEEGEKIDLRKETARIQRDITIRLSEGNVRLSEGKYLTQEDINRMRDGCRTPQPR